MNTKRQTLFVMFGAVIVTLACSLVSGVPTQPSTAQPQGDSVDEVATAVAGTMQALTAVPLENAPTQAVVPTQPSGIPVSFGYASFVIPNGLASGATPEAVPASTEEDGGPWGVAPAHLKFTLVGYPLQNKFHEPGIYVYPAYEYATVHPGAADQIKITANILAGGPLQKETLPVIPFFNAGPLMAANMQIIKFQNGTGVRALTQYAQYSGPINNHELFYHFEGLTGDNKYYIIAILPITAPVLAENEQPDAPLPADGVPFPGEMADQTYYSAVAGKLNALAPEAFTPALNMLDLLMESLLVTNT
jgi:hypothetical protein